MWIPLSKKDYSNTVLYLEENSPFTCPLYGNYASSGFAYNPFSMRSGLYYVYKDENGKINGVIAGYNDGNVMVHTSCKKAKEQVLEFICKLPFHSIWGLDGVLPDNEVISQISKIKLDKRLLQVMVQKDNFEPLEINQSNNDGIEFIRIDKKFLVPSTIAFIEKCLWEGFGFKSNRWDIRKRIKERTKLEPYWFLSSKGNYVAQAHVQAMTSLHGYIGGVCTPRNLRNLGYAKRIILEACNFIIKFGRTPALAVSSNNKIAYNLYKKTGFESIGTTLVYMQEREFKGDENANL